MQKLKVWFDKNILRIIWAIILLLIIVILSDLFPFDFLKHWLGTDKYIIFVILSISGILTFIKVTQQASWYIVGCISSVLLFEGIFHAKHNNLSLWIVFSLFFMWVACCLIFAIKLGMLEINAEQQLIKENKDLKDLNKRLEEIKKQDKINNIKNTEYLEKQHKNKISAFTKIHQEELKHQEEKLNKLLIKNKNIEKRIYESQLASLLHFTLQDKNDGNSPLALHYWQGNLDTPLADFIGETNYTYWMLELKREEKDLLSELKKEKRMIQFNALEISSNNEVKNISDKCHWLAWGVGNLDISFSCYRKAIACLINKTLPEKDYDLHGFSESSFSDSNPIGVSRDDFYAYTKFLLECIGGTISDVENNPVIVYRQDSCSGGITARLETLFGIRECIPKLERKLELEKKLERDYQQDKGWSRSR